MPEIYLSFLVRFPVYALSLRHGTLYPGNVLPDTEGQKAAEK